MARRFFCFICARAKNWREYKMNWVPALVCHFNVCFVRHCVVEKILFLFSSFFVWELFCPFCPTNYRLKKTISIISLHQSINQSINHFSHTSVGSVDLLKRKKDQLWGLHLCYFIFFPFNSSTIHTTNQPTITTIFTMEYNYSYYADDLIQDVITIEGLRTFYNSCST